MNEELCSPNEEPVKNSTPDNHLLSTPPADVYETARDIVILIDMPGVESQNVDLELDGNSLTITGKTAQSEQGGHNILTEYGRSNYFRSFYVGNMVERTGIDAELVDGVLKIVLPKSAVIISRRIPVSEDSS